MLHPARNIAAGHAVCPARRQELLPQRGEGRGHRRPSRRRGGYRDSDVYAASPGAATETGAVVALDHAFGGVEGLAGLSVTARNLALELGHLP